MKSGAFLPLQLATLVDAAPKGSGWVWEPKFDGYRLEAVLERGNIRLFTRSGHDWTDRFPDVATRLAGLGVRATFDGEVVILERGARSNFGRLQEYLAGQGKAKPSYVVFDLLTHDGKDLRELALRERRKQLQALLSRKLARGPRTVRLGTRLTGSPDALIKRACECGHEGIIGKREDDGYSAGRGQSWIKVKCGHRQEFVVLGYTDPKNSRIGLGSLLLGVHEDGALRYAGRVGSGFSDATLGKLHARLESLATTTSPLAERPAGLPRGVHWVRPKLLAEVSFSEWTRDGSLRHPVFLGLRDDKPVRNIQREEPAVSRTSKKRTAATASEKDASVSGVEITHPDRVVYPELGLTKLDVARYFERVASRMLPHVAGRPLSLVRCPEGSSEQCFFQKHWVGALPDTLESVGITQSDKAKHPYVVVRDVKGLVTLAQWGVMEVHPWGAQADAPEKPDRIFFDLDPGPGVKWAAVREAAQGVRALLEELGLASWVKTSGGKGLHVVVPIERRSTWDDVADFAKGVAVHLATHFPDRFIAKASKAAREGVIFVDWLRNTRGATAVAPYSPRARAAAGVSMPLSWRALGKLTAGDEYTIVTVQNAPRTPRDPWHEMLQHPPRLTAAMKRRLTVSR